MEISEVMSNLIPVLLGLLVLAGVWVAVELALTIRKARKETVQKANDVIDKAAPLIDEVQLTLDAANLEVMRVDGILEDVSQITSGLSTASNAVGNIASTPKNLVTNLTDKIALTSRERSRTKRTAKAMGKGKSAPVIDRGSVDKTDDENLDGATPASGFTVVEPAAARPIQPDVAPAEPAANPAPKADVPEVAEEATAPAAPDVAEEAVKADA